MVRHVGYIYDCDLVQKTPQSFKIRACRIISGKCTIAARVDSFHQSPLGEEGHQLREQIEKKNY